MGSHAMAICPGSCLLKQAVSVDNHYHTENSLVNQIFETLPDVKICSWFHPKVCNNVKKFKNSIKKILLKPMF